jgi:hypothetical protein
MIEKIKDILNEHNITSYRGVALKNQFINEYILVDTNSNDGVDSVVDYSIESIVNNTPSEDLTDKFVISYQDDILEIIDRV